MDTDAALFYLSNAAIEWLVLRIEALQNLTLFTAAFFLILRPKGQVAPGIIPKSSFSNTRNLISIALKSIN